VRSSVCLSVPVCRVHARDFTHAHKVSPSLQTHLKFTNFMPLVPSNFSRAHCIYTPTHKHTNGLADIHSEEEGIRKKSSEIIYRKKTGKKCDRKQVESVNTTPQGRNILETRKNTQTQSQTSTNTHAPIDRRCNWTQHAQTMHGKSSALPSSGRVNTKNKINAKFTENLLTKRGASISNDNRI